MTLRLRAETTLPPHSGPGGFDHGDVHGPSGLVYIAHTANGTVEVIDGERHQHQATIGGCDEASGVLYAPSTDLIFAAARATGKIVVIAGAGFSVRSTIEVGGRPNGLAWDSQRGHLLVADVSSNAVSVVDAASDSVIAAGALPGRPRWTVYDAERDRFLVNIRDPAAIALVDSISAQVISIWPVGAPGPHGLDISRDAGRAFVACDGGQVVVLDLDSGQEMGSVRIAGEPDAIWFNPAAKRLYVAIAVPGVLQSIDTEHLIVAETIETETGAKTTALDVERQTLHLFKPGTCSVASYSEA